MEDVCNNLYYTTSMNRLDQELNPGLLRDRQRY